MLIPWVVAAGALALIGGVLVLMSGAVAEGVRSLRRRSQHGTGAAGDGEGLDA